MAAQAARAEERPAQFLSAQPLADEEVFHGTLSGGSSEMARKTGAIRDPQQPEQHCKEMAQRTDDLCLRVLAPGRPSIDGCQAQPVITARSMRMAQK